ncbi:hypothetical protein FKM82_017543 [Ascaphus truei]
MPCEVILAKLQCRYSYQPCKTRSILYVMFFLCECPCYAGAARRPDPSPELKGEVVIHAPAAKGACQECGIKCCQARCSKVDNTCRYRL